MSFQGFEVRSRPEQGPPRLAALRALMAERDFAAFLVPRADAHQGEYVAPRDERLAWLTGFTGSAGFAAITNREAAIFVDGRYAVQVRAQVAAEFAPVAWPATKLADWLTPRLTREDRIGFDPWLHTRAEVEALERAGLVPVPADNLVDAIWEDRPPPPQAPIAPWPEALAGEGAAARRERIAAILRAAGQKAAVLTLPDSIAWLLNIRGGDLPHVPVALAFAILHDDARASLFIAPEKVGATALGAGVSAAPPEGFLAALATLAGPVRVDPKTAPWAVALALEGAGVEIAWEEDPCLLPKAQKTPAEIAATAEAHLRDGAAMVEFLAWLDARAPQGGLTEIDVVERLEDFRRATGCLRDISFDTIAGAGPNGAIVHYRVTRETNRTIAPGDLLLVDSGGQYEDGTTDVTRTVTTGSPTQGQVAAFTRVLRGMIAISRLRFPAGLAGRDIDALARAPLWMEGQDYDHGTGHGVGVFLSVHEGPARISRLSEVPLRPGMILSNEPGYYREGCWGIRIENLLAVEDAPALGGADPGRAQLAFRTLTWVPIDRRLIDRGDLHPGERDWLDAYHAGVRARIGPRVSEAAGAWLAAATQAV